MKKAEEERLAAEAAAAAAAYEARLSIGAIPETKVESNDGSAAETPSTSTKVVTLVEGPSSAGWKVGPTGSILKRSMSNQTTISNSGSKSGSKRVGRK